MPERNSLVLHLAVCFLVRFVESFGGHRKADSRDKVSFVKDFDFEFDWKRGEAGRLGFCGCCEVVSSLSQRRRK